MNHCRSSWQNYVESFTMPFFKTQKSSKEKIERYELRRCSKLFFHSFFTSQVYLKNVVKPKVYDSVKLYYTWRFLWTFVLKYWKSIYFYINFNSKINPAIFCNRYNFCKKESSNTESRFTLTQYCCNIVNYIYAYHGSYSIQKYYLKLSVKK